MSFIHDKGNPTSPVWVIVDKPFDSDIPKGYLYSGPMGWMFDKMMQEAGINDYYITCWRPDIDHPESFRNIDGALNQYKPPIIITLGAIGWKLLPQLTPSRRSKKFNPDEDSELSKYAGSLLISKYLNYPHYVIPTYSPVDIVKQWKMRDIVINCDLGKAASELEYWKTNQKLEPSPIVNAKIDFESFDELLYIINGMRDSEYVSCDIETIYPRAPTKTQPSQFYKILPGYPVTVGLAVNTTDGISFDFFRESVSETRELWKCLDRLLRNTPQVGQNYFNFDANFFEMLGFKIPLEKCRDTMIMHHILWAELPHKLQFLARQYTRHSYWKDEGAGWSIKNMRAMKIYNVKDVVATLEIFHKEREELRARGLE